VTPGVTAGRIRATSPASAPTTSTPAARGRRTPGTRPDIEEVLAGERSRTEAQIDALTRGFDDIVEASELVATDDEHDPEGATIAFERAQVAALLRDARTLLADLDRALARLADGTYGTCVACGEPIAPARLEARPATPTCVTCAV
jgi:RNA polymerase-binding transcription factor DksA